MEKNSLKTLAELFKMASQFFDEAAELVTGYARREEILRREPKPQQSRFEVPEVSEKKDRAIEKKEKPVDKKEKPVEKKEKPVERKERPVENTEKNVEKKEKPVEKKEKVPEINVKETKEKAIEQPEKSKEGKPRKKVSPNKDGYILFLNHTIKKLKKDPELKDFKVADYSKMIKSSWDQLSSSEREIWGEKATEESENTKIVELIPQKTHRSDESRHQKSGEEDQGEESLKKKKKSS